jgi:glycosyltransferase involved in cell wall biosynthesis
MGKSGGISVIVPVYNEEKIIAPNAKKLADFLKNSKGWDFEVILCNNGSTDATFEKAKALSEKNKGITATTIKEKGTGRAIKKGLSIARFETIIFFPIDLAFNLSFITDATKILDDGKADVVVGSKGARGSVVKRPFSRQFYSFFYTLLINVLFGLRVKDPTGTLAFKKKIAGNALITAKSDDWFLGPEFLINARRQGLGIKEIAVRVDDMRKDSKVSPIIDSVKLFMKILRKKFY